MKNLIKFGFQKYAKNKEEVEFNSWRNAVEYISNAEVGMYKGNIRFVWNNGNAMNYVLDKKLENSLMDYLFYEELSMKILYEESFIRQFSHYLEIDNKEIFKWKSLKSSLKSLWGENWIECDLS